MMALGLARGQLKADMDLINLPLNTNDGSGP